MTDRKTTAEKDRDETSTLSSIEQIAKESGTDESRLHQLDVNPRASNASYSLERLEQDLRTLHSKWQAVEQEIADRDEQILGLQQEMQHSQELHAAMEADLEGAIAEREQLKEDLRVQNRQFEKDLARQSRSSQKTQDLIRELESENTSLRVHLQELQAYIDGRKDDWSGLKEQLQKYEHTISGMSASLESHDENLARKEEDKAALALKAMELERDLAELKGRYAEKESAIAELQQTLDDQSRELGSLNAETISLHKNVEKLEKKLEHRDSTVRSLKKEIKEHSRDSSSLEELLSDEKATIQGQQSRIAELEELLSNKDATEQTLRDKASESERKLERIRSSANEHEIRAAELQAMLLESESEQKRLHLELEAQMELVEVLEREVAAKQESLDVLDRSADRISAIHSGIRELDFQIDDHWVQQPARVAEQSAEIFENPDEVMLDPEALFDGADEGAEHVIVTEGRDGAKSVRFPILRREVTIGRSPRSDIRLRSKFISRIHARIKVDGDNAIIEDAGSTNGFLVNSVATKLHVLAHGDTLEIGDCKLRYLHPTTAE